MKVFIHSSFNEFFLYVHNLHYIYHAVKENAVKNGSGEKQKAWNEREEGMVSLICHLEISQGKGMGWMGMSGMRHGRERRGTVDMNDEFVQNARRIEKYHIQPC